MWYPSLHLHLHLVNKNPGDKDSDDNNDNDDDDGGDDDDNDDDVGGDEGDDDAEPPGQCNLSAGWLKVLSRKTHLSRFTRYSIIALMLGSHGLSARRVRRTKSSRPEGPQPRGRGLEGP